MIQPIVTAICCTYGRPTRVQNAIAQFLAQDYPNKRMVILNTFPRQEFYLEPITLRETVNLVNFGVRPGTMGECRNEAIDFAEDGIIVVWDDDDHYRSDHLSTIAKHFTEGVQWVWLDSMFFTEKGRITRIITGSPNVFAFTTEAWRTVGGYKSINTGEDRDFIARVNGMKGVPVKLSPEQITFAYGWDNGDFHLSGHDFDKPGVITGYDKIAAEINALADCGKIPTGTICLTPKLTFDADSEMRDWLAQNHFSGTKANDVCILELGRLGDIINVLPIALNIHNTFATPYMMVSREFSSVLEGVSYVKPYVTNLRQDQVNEAIADASRRFKHVLVTQVWGENWAADRHCAAFNQESWRMAGFLNKFDDSTWRPVFDQRDAAREKPIVERAHQFDKPVLLVNVTHGVSSPFEHGQAILSLITGRLADRFKIIDLASFVATRIYDLIALMEAAAVGCFIDTVPLHLAAATNMPVVVIKNSKPWLGTASRSPDVCEFTYADVLDRKEELIEAIVAGAQIQREPMSVVFPKQAPVRRLIHAVEIHQDTEKREQKRKRAAQASWDTLYCDSGVIPAHYYEYERDATSIGDIRQLPFLKDCLRFAMNQAGPDDIIFLTNDDVWLHPDTADLVMFQASVYGACCAQRVDFSKPIPPNRTPDELAAMGHKHFGRDLFAFTMEWLNRQWDEIGDFVLGASDFDLCLCAMIRKEQGLLSTKRLFKDVIFPSELPLGYVCHCLHSAKWTHPANIDSAASQKHNRKLFRAWGEKHCPTLKFMPGDVV